MHDYMMTILYIRSVRVSDATRLFKPVSVLYQVGKNKQGHDGAFEPG